jgi:hypothetical protein
MNGSKCERTLILTKDFLAIYLRTAACEEGMISSPEEAKELEKKLSSWDEETFEAILSARCKSLREDMASGKKEKGLFDARSYGAQADTIEGIIRVLPNILNSGG